MDTTTAAVAALLHTQVLLLALPVVLVVVVVVRLTLELMARVEQVVEIMAQQQLVMLAVLPEQTQALVVGLVLEMEAHQAVQVVLV